MKLKKRAVFNEIRQVLYPDDIRCMVCGREMHPSRYGLCETCKLSLNDNYCLRCGKHKVGIGDYCDECIKLSLKFDEARSAVNYDAAAKSIVHRLKYGNARYLANILSESLFDILLREHDEWDFDCITFVPIHKNRERKRGYNQAKLLALATAERVDKPCLDLLEKIRATPNQASLGAHERFTNLNGAFSVKAKPPEHVVLIDDVMTTGATASECARTLKNAGAKIVYVLTFASVPEQPVLDTQVQNISEFRNQ